jgi:hypothetical protein
MPENAVPARETVTGWLYQPFASGGRSGTAVADGLEVSTFNGKLMEAVPLGSHDTAHDTVAARSVYVCDTHPVVDRGTGSTCHVTLTGLNCQAPDWSHAPLGSPGLHVTDRVFALAAAPPQSASASRHATGTNRFIRPTP